MYICFPPVLEDSSSLEGAGRGGAVSESSHREKSEEILLEQYGHRGHRERALQALRRLLRGTLRVELAM